MMEVTKHCIIVTLIGLYPFIPLFVVVVLFFSPHVKVTEWHQTFAKIESCLHNLDNYSIQFKLCAVINYMDQIMIIMLLLSLLYEADN